MTTGGMGPVLEQIRRLAGTPAGAELSDGQLLDQLIHGDREAAFGMLVRRHGPMVLGVCRRIHLGRVNPRCP